MKLTKKNILSMLTAVGLTLSGASQATLYDRGSGLIYDDVLDVTWLQDANYAKTSGYAKDRDGKMSWSVANTWAAQLRYDGGLYGTIDDWRLPDVKPVNGSDFNYSRKTDGTTDRGYNINSTQSEMGYMFYQNLGNNGLYDTSGNKIGCAGVFTCLTNAGLFDNLKPYAYWSAVEYAPIPGFGWSFHTNHGIQGSNGKRIGFHAWAVRSGDVAVVPVPTAFWLMASSLLGMAGLRKKR